MAICVDRGAEAAVRCPMAVPDALGPTDGRDGQGQGLLQVAASRCKSLHHKHASCSDLGGAGGAGGGSHTILARAFGVSAPSKIVITTDRVWNGRAPPPSSSLSSLSSCSLAAANDTRDAIALSRRASPRPSELGIALVFPALARSSTVQYGIGAGPTLLEREGQDSTQDQGRPCCVHVLVDAHGIFQGLVVSSRPLCLPVLASFPSPTVLAHRPTATRRLPSRRTTLDAGATAVSLHPRATWRHSEALNDPLDAGR
ncbi:hypothetical protein ACHAPE_003212 [Trichoderma viride]